MTTSSDGYLVATVDPTYAGVLLAVNFTGAAGIAAGDTVTVTQAATDPNSGVAQAVNVRGLDRLNAPGGVVAGYDAEAPTGAVCTYTATAYNAAGTVIVSSTTATAEVSAPATQVWLKALATPSLSQLVTVQTYPDWAYGINQGTFQVIGREDQVIKSDVRQSGTGTLSVKVTTAAALTALMTLLKSPGPYLMQAPGFGDPDQYVQAGAIQPGRLVHAAGEPLRMVSVPLTVTGRPATAGSSVAIPGHTYADSLVRWPLYSSRTGTYLSRATS